jgi:hypothetical protein
MGTNALTVDTDGDDAVMVGLELGADVPPDLTRSVQVDGCLQQLRRSLDCCTRGIID